MRLASSVYLITKSTKIKKQELTFPLPKYKTVVLLRTWLDSEEQVGKKKRQSPYGVMQFYRQVKDENDVYEIS